MFLEGQMLVDFKAWLAIVPAGFKRCPACPSLVSLGDEPAFAEDEAGTMRTWHRSCLERERAHRRNKAVKRARSAR